MCKRFSILDINTLTVKLDTASVCKLYLKPKCNIKNNKYFKTKDFCSELVMNCRYIVKYFVRALNKN